MMSDSWLAGKGAVVTGGSRGIGRAIAEALARAGAGVIVNGRDEGCVDEVVTKILESGGRSQPGVGSIADFDLAGRLITQCVSEFGSVDVLVNCAGIAEPPGSSILDLDPEDWRELIDVHLTGTFNSCRHAVPRMVEQGAGSIINVSSHAYTGRYGGTGYAAGKGGVNSLTFALAAELREHSVRANVLCPGARTRLSTGADYEEHIELLHQRGLLDDVSRQASLAPPEAYHVGPMAVFLSSDLSADVTGRIFTARGGYVGLHRDVGEELLALRDESTGAWPVDELSAQIREKLGLDIDQGVRGDA
ncbi:MAG: short-chain dehydrogenase [Spirochaeta sp.]|nr:short-chain dehydrogenase [Spirochaeta sp.]RPG03960.1 MAG: SDR family oxidoreductase [Proteobacteria bacterium TMED72]